MSALLEVAGLAKHFPVRRGAFGLVSGHVRAVDGVDFQLDAGETLAIVGESGCGKSTVGRLVLRLIEPSAGQVRFEGEDLLALSDNEMRGRRQRMQVIFQDPYASLNPRMTVGAMLGEPLMLHGLAKSEAARKARVGELLELVGLRAEHARRYPHEFSGGQRQRLAIARALVKRPPVYVFDDSFSALDTATDARLRAALAREVAGATMIVVAQRVSTIRDADLIIVLEDGAVVARGTHDELLATSPEYAEIVESAATTDLFERPAHEYTRALLEAVPAPGRGL